MRDHDRRVLTLECDSRCTCHELAVFADRAFHVCLRRKSGPIARDLTRRRSRLLSLVRADSRQTQMKWPQFGPSQHQAAWKGCVIGLVLDRFAGGRTWRTSSTLIPRTHHRDTARILRLADRRSSTRTGVCFAASWRARKREDDKRIRSICGSRFVDQRAETYKDGKVNSPARNE